MTKTSRKNKKKLKLHTSPPRQRELKPGGVATSLQLGPYGARRNSAAATLMKIVVWAAKAVCVGIHIGAGIWCRRLGVIFLTWLGIHIASKLSCLTWLAQGADGLAFACTMNGRQNTTRKKPAAAVAAATTTTTTAQERGPLPQAASTTSPVPTIPTPS